MYIYKSIHICVSKSFAIPNRGIRKTSHFRATQTLLVGELLVGYPFCRIPLWGTVLRPLFWRLPIRFNGHGNFHPLELRVCLSQTL